MPDAVELLRDGARRTRDGTRDASLWRDAAVLDALTHAGTDGDAVRALASGYDALLLLEPRLDTDDDVRLSVVGSAERRHRGAFSTPPDVAASLARRAIPALPCASVVDPACGSGALLRAAAARLLALGTPADDVASALHGVDADPVAVALGRAVLDADLAAAGATASARAGLQERIVVGDALRPEIWSATPTMAAVLRPGGPGADPVSGWAGGFAAVVANPPWERLKVLARDWEGAAPEALRATRFAAAAAVRAGGRHPLTGVGELNAYLPFLETCWRLLAPDGHASVLVPAGVAADRSGARLLHALVAAGALQRMHLFDPPQPLFAGVNARVGVAVLDLAGSPAARRDAVIPAEVAVGLAGPDTPAADRAWPLDAATLRLVNPATWTAPVFTSARDAALVTAVHRRWPVLRPRPSPLGEEETEEGPWGLSLHTSLHMTREAKWFRDAPAPGLEPLWEAKHTSLLDPSGGRSAARYWVPAERAREKYGELCARGWLAGFRNVSTSDSPRTLSPVPLPAGGVANSLPLIGSPRLPLLMSVLASLPVDHLVRQKHSGANLNFHKIEQLPLPPPEVYDAPAPWDPTTSASTWLLHRLAESIVWIPGLEALAHELEALGVPDVARLAEVSAERRALARAEADAAHALLLGMGREDLAHVLTTFPALQRQHERLSGRYALPAQVLAAYDRLTGT